MRFPSNKAFSVAEAMIMLLIVSVALAAMAPILSKKAVSTGSSGSKWLYTRNGTDITRPGGNVGIGIPINTNPGEKLHVKGGKVLIENNDASGLEIIYNSDGSSVSIKNKKNNTNTVLGINKWGNTIINYQGDTVTSYMNCDGNIYKRVAAGDIMQTVPSGMFAYFNGNCPFGWTNMGANGWGGRFLRIAGWDNTLGVNTPHGQWQNQAVGWHEHTLDPDIRSVNINYGGGGGPYSVVLSGDVQHYGWWASSRRSVKAVGGGGNETRPNNVALNFCRKD